MTGECYRAVTNALHGLLDGERRRLKWRAADAAWSLVEQAEAQGDVAKAGAVLGVHEVLRTSSFAKLW